MRSGATIDGNTVSYLNDTNAGLPRVVADGSRTYLHADGLGVVSEIDNSSTARYPLTDALGSVRGLTSSAGALIGARSYEAFGAPRAAAGASSLFGFTGEPSDATGHALPVLAGCEAERVAGRRRR